MEKAACEKLAIDYKYQIKSHSESGLCGIIVIEKLRSAEAQREISIWPKEERLPKQSGRRL